MAGTIYKKTELSLQLGEGWLEGTNRYNEPGEFFQHESGLSIVRYHLKGDETEWGTIAEADFYRIFDADGFDLSGEYETFETLIKCMNDYINS